MTAERTGLEWILIVLTTISIAVFKRSAEKLRIRSGLKSKLVQAHDRYEIKKSFHV